MLRLMLLRHAKTQPDAPSGRDFDRELDPRGERDSVVIGEWLARQVHTPDRVLVSPAARARQTWQLVAAALARAGKTAEAVTLDQLYGAMPGDLLDAIRSNGRDARRLMVVAHNPGLHEFGFALTGSGDATARSDLADNLPTGGLAILDFDTALWTGVAFQQGKLTDFVTPKGLKA